jgi:hypothetical protein
MSPGDTPPEGPACASWYELDEQDRVRAVSPDWDRFAHANGGKDAAGGRVIGRPLRSFIAGDVSRMFLEAALQAVRVTRRARTLRYRCDAPRLERHLEMTLIPLADGGVRVTHQPRHLAERADVGRFVTLIDRAARVDAGPATAARPPWRCTQCLRLSPHVDGPWRDPSPLARPEDEPLAVRYVLCRDCRGEMSRRLGSESAA